MARDIEALHRFLAERSEMPFDWGRRANDCVSFALTAVEAQTGDGRWGNEDWSSLLGAKRILNRIGGVEAFVDARFRRIQLSRAARGDIAGVAHPEFGTALTIVEGAMLAGPGEAGIFRLPRPAMIVAWSAEAPGHE